MGISPPINYQSNQRAGGKEYKPSSDALRSRVFMVDGVLYVSDSDHTKRRPLLEFFDTHIRVGCTKVSREAWDYLTERWGREVSQEDRWSDFKEGMLLGLGIAGAIGVAVALALLAYIRYH